MGLSTSYSKAETDIKLTRIKQAFGSGINPKPLKIGDPIPTEYGGYILADLGDYGFGIAEPDKWNVAFLSAVGWEIVDVPLNLNLDIPGGAASYESVQNLYSNVKESDDFDVSSFTIPVGSGGYFSTPFINVSQGELVKTFTRSEYQRVEFYDSNNVKTEFGIDGQAITILHEFDFIAPSDGKIKVVSYIGSYNDAKYIIYSSEKIYLSPDDLDVSDGAFSFYKGNQLWENLREGSTSDTVILQNQYPNNLVAGYVTSGLITVEKGQKILVESRLLTSWGLFDFYDSNNVKTVIGNGSGLDVLTNYAWFAPTDGKIQLSTSSNYTDGKITLFATGGKIYLTPDDLQDISANNFDVGDRYEIDKPESLIKIDFTTTNPIPNSKDDGKCNGEFKITVGDLSFKKFGNIEVQGSSSAAYPKKNWTIALFNDADLTSRFNLRVNNSVYLNEWIYKANWIDATHLRNIAANRLWSQIEQSRSGYFPREIDNTYVGKTGADSYDTGATGIVDGFPCRFYINGVFYGIGMFNSGKKRENYNLDNNLATHIQIETGVRQMDFVNMTLAAIDYEYRSPKSSLVSQAETKINTFKAFAALPQAEFTAQFNSVMNRRNMIDYVIFLQAMFLPDNLGNNVMLTSWGQQFYFMPYDLDNSFGLHWAGTSIWQPNQNAFTVRNDIPQNTINFWLKCKVALSADLATRYQELKAKKILTVENIYRILKELEVVFGQKYYKDEQLKWADIPSKNLTNVNQICSWFEQRLIWLDSYFV